MIGPNSNGVLINGSASPTLTNCVVRQSVQYGINITYATPGQTVVIDNAPNVTSASPAPRTRGAPARQGAPRRREWR